MQESKSNPFVDQDRSAYAAANAVFWNDLCGSAAARAWGITDRSMDSLRRYDENFLGYYPYLSCHVPWTRLHGKRVLEIGLGYGTVSQKLAETGAVFTGLDIAANPVAMVRHRLRQNGLPGNVVRGDITVAPFADASFDVIVAIGALHHTGNLRQAIASCSRLLAPGGRLIGMVYYAYSYRKFWQEPMATIRHLLRELSDGSETTMQSGDTCTYDRSIDGSAAPFTEFVSVRSLRSMCSDFDDFTARTENALREPPLILWSRDKLLASPLPRICGLDLYWSCVRPSEPATKH
jgi:SAM-dependent methyltransferase